MLLFLANYPDASTLHEGMSQRMVAIDEQVKDQQRAYLFVSHRLYWKREAVEVKKDVIQYRCNFFRHFFFILRLLRGADTVYIHSVINVLPWLPIVPALRKRSNVILDAHGVVPEEHMLSGLRLKSRLYGLSEGSIIHRANVVIIVTRAMEQHFRKKYPKSNPQYVRYTILPHHLLNDGVADLLAETDEIVRIVYSGNTQKWQNIDLMISVIKRNLSKRIKYDILTGEPEIMQKHLETAGLDKEPNINVFNVSPGELKHYYKRAHYGFVLRDDINVNRVACPTKLVEYLYYGIIPVVKTSKIGDFDDLGYEYINYDSLSAEITAKKSEKNHQLMKKLLEADQSLNLCELITKDA